VGGGKRGATGGEESDLTRFWPPKQCPRAGQFARVCPRSEAPDQNGRKGGQKKNPELWDAENASGPARKQVAGCPREGRGVKEPLDT